MDMRMVLLIQIQRVMLMMLKLKEMMNLKKMNMRMLI